MRMRNKPWAAPELNACPFFVRDPALRRGTWHDWFLRRQPLYLELGCGKGLFLAGLAPENPQINYMGIDLKDTVLAPAKRNIEQAFLAAGRQPDNVVLLSYDIERIAQVLAPGDTVDRIHINFCNPWPKPRHKKRRLTHPHQLENYKTFLKPGGEVHLKTDDGALFADSLRYFAQSGFDILWQTQDLHALNLPEDVMTEHEIMFLKKGIPIKALIAKFRL